MPKTPVLIVSVALMLAMAAVASADDTVVNIGYDEANRMLLLNTSPADSAFDCTLEDGPVTVGYGIADGENGTPVDTLESESETGELAAFIFLNRPFEDVDTELFTPADEPATYTGADGECGLFGASAGGPNGQINHGQMMKLMHEIYGTGGKGCLNRIFAQSDLGKGDQQLRTSDVDPEFVAGNTGTVEFKTFIADCEQGPKDKGDAHPGRGKDKADSPGKAKGRNK